MVTGMEMACNPYVFDEEDTLMLSQILGNVHIIKSTFEDEHYDWDLVCSGRLFQRINVSIEKETYSIP